MSKRKNPTGKRTLCALATLALTWIASAAAVEHAEDGVGDVLIFPFYIAENSWDTLINVKAASRLMAVDYYSATMSLRVVIRDGKHGEIIDSFNTYATSPNGRGTWRAALFQNEQGETRLRVGEGQCLVDSNGQAHAGTGVEIPIQASLGMIEVYSVLEPSRFSSPQQERNILTDCEDFAANWRAPDGAWVEDPLGGWERTPPPPTKINGQAIVLNVDQGLSGVYDALALDDFLNGEYLVQSAPGSLSPNLTDARPNTFADWFEDMTYILGGISYANDVTALDEVNASTDWVISFLTSGYQDSKPYNVMIDGEMRNCSSFGSFADPPGPGQPSVSMPGRQAESIFFSASADGTVLGTIPSDMQDHFPLPNREVGVALCNAVNVVTFNEKPSLLLPADSPYLENVNGLTGTSTQLWWQPPWESRHSPSPPVFALRLTRFINETLVGGSVRANYLFLDVHRRHLRIDVIGGE